MSAPHEFIYKETASVRLSLRVFFPLAPGPRPALLLFHGGSWIKGSPAKLDWIGERLAAHGWVVGSAQYRLVGRETNDVRDAVADAISATAWFADSVRGWNLRPDMICVGGASAGGQLAFCVALARSFVHPDLPAAHRFQPAALVTLNPVVSVKNPRFAPLFDGFAESLDPTTLVGDGLPPTLILHGSADGVVPLTEVQAFAAKAGANVQVEVFDAEPHAFFNPGIASPALLDRVEERVAAFLSLISR